ncbi:ATP-dependent DNA helicase RecG [Mariniluteicoccus endophyticus]
MWRTPAYQALDQDLAEVVGARTAKDLASLRLETVGDLLRHVPRRYLRGAENSQLSDLREGDDVAVVAVVAKTEVRQGARRRVETWVTDGTSQMRLTFFAPQKRPKIADWWAAALKPGRRGLFAGKVGMWDRTPQMTHPAYVILDDDGVIVAGSKQNQKLARVASRAGLIGIYPATAKLPTWDLVEVIDLVREGLGELPDPLPPEVVAEAGVLPLAEAIEAVHSPESVEKAEAGHERLLFDEAFAVQAAMAYRRAAARKQPAVPRPRRDDGLLARFDAQLPFTLTEGQQAVSEEVFAGLAQDFPMQRLLQGEVGSGKTIVALRAMLAVVDAGGQAALMAPTEVLAQQHFQTITDQLGDLVSTQLLGGVEPVLLSGSMPAAEKKAALLKIVSGEAGIVIGTHALLADRVQFPDLGLVVVDEQHRFGVEQRAALGDKGATRPHVLVMTATPIPRTVAITVFGDLEVSTLREIPAGRSEVTTTVVDETRRPHWVDRAWQRVREEAAEGHQVFVVCPQITPTDRSSEAMTSDEEHAQQHPPRNVTELYAELTAGPLAGLRVGMLHGQLPPADKDEVMGRFAAGELDVLVSTTVVEVGVNVPNATGMIICDADRFGISQLHQLRGRVGRGAHPGFCLLLTKADADSDAAHRLAAVARTRDGFELAQADLAQRREGNVLGASQSGGRSGLRLLRVLDHADLIVAARDIAERWAERDPERSHPGVADAVDQLEQQAAGEWLERG